MFQFWWVVLHTMGAQGQARTGKSLKTLWYVVASAAEGWSSPFSHHKCVWITKLGGGSVLLSEGFLGVQQGDGSRSWAWLTARSPNACRCWAAKTLWLHSRGAWEGKYGVFSQNNNPFSSSGGLYAQRSLLTGVYFANTSCSVMVFTPAEEPKSRIVLLFL